MIDHGILFFTVKRREFVLGTTASALVLGMQRIGATELTAQEAICPKCQPPARTLATFDVRELTSDVADLQLTLYCLQGIINRRQPRLYLVQDHYDELWLDWLRERGDIDSVLFQQSRA